MAENRYLLRLSEGKRVEIVKGVFKTTMVYNEQLMLCHFALSKGAIVPRHNHVAVQNGYVLKGKVKFFREEEENSFIVEPGDGYLFDSEEYHGAEVLEDSEVIECFTPMRPEYLDS